MPEAFFCIEVLTWAKQTMECFLKGRTKSLPALSLALVPYLPGGLNIQVIRVYQQKNSQNRTDNKELLESEFIKSIYLSKLHAKSRNHSTQFEELISQALIAKPCIRQLSHEIKWEN